MERRSTFHCARLFWKVGQDGPWSVVRARAWRAAHLAPGRPRGQRAFGRHKGGETICRQSASRESGFRRVGLKQILDFKGWNSQVESPGAPYRAKTAFRGSARKPPAVAARVCPPEEEACAEEHPDSLARNLGMKGCRSVCHHWPSPRRKTHVSEDPQVREW